MKKQKTTPVEPGLDDPPATSITPAEYQAILSGVHLVGIALNALGCDVTGRKKLFEAVGEATPEIGLSSEYTNVNRDGQKRVIVLQQFGLQVHLDDKPEPVLELDCVFQLDYEVNLEFTDEFFAVFSRGPLLLQVVPYIRELVQSMTMRLGVPPLTLPMVTLSAPTTSE